MLYTAAALVSAFQAPGLMASTGRTPSVVMDTSWRRSYNGRGADVTPNPVVAAAPAAPAIAAAPASTLSVEQACVFLADVSLDCTTADKKAYLSSNGVSDFVIAQAECVAPESNVQGHPQLPGAAAAGGDSVMTVAQACVFLADGSASTADKKAYLSSKGVSDFVIAQAECVSPESNVQGHPELPGAEMKGVVVPTADAATAEAAMAAELYKMAPAEAADYLAKNREMLIAAGVKVADLDEAKKVIDGAMA